MKTDFILIATGHATMPRINHVMFCDSHSVTQEANKVASALSKAGYFSFDLYDVRADGAHVVIGRVTIETPEPVACFIGEGVKP